MTTNTTSSVVSDVQKALEIIHSQSPNVQNEARREAQNYLDGLGSRVTGADGLSRLSVALLGVEKDPLGHTAHFGLQVNFFFIFPTRFECRFASSPLVSSVLMMKNYFLNRFWF
jgi:hypothetical protein